MERTGNSRDASYPTTDDTLYATLHTAIIDKYLINYLATAKKILSLPATRLNFNERQEASKFIYLLAITILIFLSLFGNKY